LTTRSRLRTGDRLFQDDGDRLQQEILYRGVARDRRKLERAPEVTLSAFVLREVWMPWKASSVMEERLRFVARLLDGEAMTEVCREFGISRKTGYKIFDRYKEHGLEALSDRSRRPVRYANQLPHQLETLIVRLKSEKPHWGARKIRELLVRRLDGDIKVPAKSTIHAVLDRHDLVKPAPPRARHAAVARCASQ